MESPEANENSEDELTKDYGTDSSPPLPKERVRLAINLRELVKKAMEVEWLARKVKGKLGRRMPVR